MKCNLNFNILFISSSSITERVIAAHVDSCLLLKPLIFYPRTFFLATGALMFHLSGGLSPNARKFKPQEVAHKHCQVRTQRINLTVVSPLGLTLKHKAYSAPALYRLYHAAILLKIHVLT